MQSNPFYHWRTNFFAGLAVVLPAVVSIALLRWIFGTVSNVTDMLLVFMPARLTHENAGQGPMAWYWSLFALVLALALITLIGHSARYYAGKQLIEWVDQLLLRVPLLNKIYGALKQVNEALSSGNKTAFKQVVLIEFPRPGVHTVGFITGDQNPEIDRKTGRKTVCVFVPTTPNPTGGFLMLLPVNEVIHLDMSVADGIKFIISLGAIAPEHRAAAIRELGLPPPPSNA